MGKALKIIGIVVGVIVVVVVVAAVALLVFVNPNDYRDQIQSVVKQQTGRNLTIAGDLHLSVFPWLGLELGKVSLGNAPGFGAEPFASVSAVDVRVRLLPLLHKELEVGKLTLEGLQLHLQRNRQGRTNWADLAGGRPAAGAPAHPAATPGGAKLAALTVGGLDVRDAALTYSDAASGASYRIDHMNLTTGQVAPGKPADIALHMDYSAKPPDVTGTLALRMRLTLDQALQRFGLQATRLQVTAKGPTLGVPEAQLEVQGDIDLDMAKQTVAVRGLQLRALDVTADGELSGQHILSAPAFAGKLRVEPFNPRALLKRLGQAVPKLRDPAALGKLTVDLAFRTSPEQAALRDIKVLLDDTALTGQVAVSSFRHPAIAFNFKADAIDLDRYLPPQTSAPPSPAATTAAGATELPLAPLRTLNVDGNVTIGELTAYNLHSKNVRITIRAKDGRIRINPATAEMYQGHYDGDIGLDVTGRVPRLSMKEALKAVQVGPLLKDLMGDDKLHGTANLRADLTATGSTPDQMRKSLNGTAGFAFTNGMVKGINIARLLRDARARLKGEPVPKEQGPDTTDFTSLTGTVKVVNGVVRNDDLNAKSPLLRVDGAGTADLVKQSADYRLKVAVVGSLQGQGGRELAELKGLTIPLRIHGPFTKPAISVELGPAFKGRLEAEKKRLHEQQQQKIEQEKRKLKRQMQEKLKKLMNR